MGASFLIQSSKVLWGEGLFLRPAHSQRLDADPEGRPAEALRALHPYAWGLRRLALDSDALAGDVLQFTDLQGLFADGEPFSAPHEDELPAPLVLGQIPAGTSELTFHLALVPMRPHGSDFVPTDPLAGGAWRGAQQQAPASDWFTGAAAADIAVLRRSLRVLPESEPRDPLASLPVCHLRRSPTGAFELDARFIAPSLAIAAAPALQPMLRRLLDALQAQVDGLQGLHREPSQHAVAFRSGDMASFWLLHTASSAFAALSHLHHHPGLHPERLYERMLELAGALIAFSKRHALADLPAYQHALPGAGFSQLDEILHDLLAESLSRFE